MMETCQGALTPGVGDPANLCPGTQAKMDWDALVTCACTGKCKTDCGTDSFCTAMKPPAGMACGACLMDMMNGCGAEYTTCNQ